MGIMEIGFYFLLEIQPSFFQAYRFFEILRFRKKSFFLNLDFGDDRKIYGFVPCIPILGFFLLKVQNECVCAILSVNVDSTATTNKINIKATISLIFTLNEKNNPTIYDEVSKFLDQKNKEMKNLVKQEPNKNNIPILIINSNDNK